GVNAIIGLGASAVLSPDGTVVAFVGVKSRADGADSIQLFVRRTDQLEAAALPGTERGRVPFFSPDGQWIAFFSDGKLKKTPTAGGAVVTVADVAQLPRGGAWGENGTIVLAGGRVPGLVRVPAVGGVPEALTTLDAEEARHSWPQMLPGDRAVLYTSY